MPSVSNRTLGDRKGMKSGPLYATFPVEMAFPSSKVSIPRRSAAVVLMRLAAGASGLGDALLRAREVRVPGESDAGTEALVERLVRLGSELRVELKLADGSTVWGRLPRESAEQLELREGQIVAVSVAAAPLARAA
jgi:TOBE domain